MFTSFYFSLKCQLAATAKYVLGSLFNFLILKIQERKVARLSKGEFSTPSNPFHLKRRQAGTSLDDDHHLYKKKLTTNNINWTTISSSQIS